MRILTKTLLGTAAVGALAAGFLGSAAAQSTCPAGNDPTAGDGGVICLDPAATNSGLPSADKIGNGQLQSVAEGGSAFWATNGNTSWDGLMSILGTPTSGGTQSFNEAGVFWVTEFQTNNASQVSDVGSLSNGGGSGSGTYYVLGTVDLVGTGTWTKVGGKPSFSITSVTGLDISLWGASGQVTFKLNAPTQSDATNPLPTNSELSQYGITSFNPHGGTLDLLGQVSTDVTLAAPGSVTAACTTLSSTACDATEELSANGLLDPTTGTTGTDGFFEQPTDVNITFEVSPDTTDQETRIDDCASDTNFSGECTTVKVTGGGGSISFLPQAVVPEPASLMLFGSGLLGLGAALRRRRRKAG